MVAEQVAKLDADKIAKLIALTVSLNGSLIQLLNPIRDSLKWRKRGIAEVRSLEWPFELTVTFPTWLQLVLLLIVLVLSVIGLTSGAMTSLSVKTPDWMVSVQERALLLSVCYGFLLPVVHTQALSRFFGLLVRSLAVWQKGHWRYVVGVANSEWYLDHKEFLAMNINVSNCERLAQSIVAKVLRDKHFEEGPIQRPSPATADELAAYLLFGFIVMGHVEDLWPYDKGPNERCWNYLAWASIKHKAFSPDFIARHENGTYYDALRELPDEETAKYLLGPHPLPDDHLIRRDIRRAVELLGQQCDFYSSKLGTFTSGKYSEEILLENLKQYPRFQSRTWQRLFLIQSAQFGLWSEMERGPFPYPFSRGISVLLLNSHSLVEPSTTQLIDPDDAFQQVSISAQQKITETVISLARELDAALGNVGDLVTTAVVANRAASDWQIADRVDQMLYNHVRAFCTHRKAEAGINMPACPLSLTPGSACFCDAAESPWRLSDSGYLVRG